ncbi:MAG TPA: hypothetical protein DCK93_03700 [Blastocatellia bacterium]|jgi:phage terminase small subunit|nr:hypothetical protein [Blastocatellia bacterium]
MGLFDDILKGLPVNPLLREKIAELEAKYAATETENAILKDDLHNAKVDNQELKQQIEKLTHKNDLDKVEVEFLKAISAHESLTAQAIAELFKLHLQRAVFHLQNLVNLKYITAFSAFGEASIHNLTHKGREYLIKNNLI